MYFMSKKARAAVKEAKRKEAEAARRALLAEDLMVLLQKPEEPKMMGMISLFREYYDAPPASVFHRIKQIADQEFKTSLESEIKYGALSNRLLRERKPKGA